jgi:hypothetical protein
MTTILIIVFFILVLSVYACEDDNTFRFKGKERKDCNWVRDYPETRCARVDPGDSTIIVKNYCKKSCGLCQAEVCKDDQIYRFNGRQKKSCDWVKKDLARCKKGDTNGDKVEEICRKTCGFECQEDPQNEINVPVQKKDIGEQCTDDNECITGQCDGGGCVQNLMCKSLDGRPWTPEYNQDMLMLVFVGSDFSDVSDFAASVHNAYDEMKTAPMFDNSYDQDRMRYRAFYVETTSSSFCHYNCDGIERLLCCDKATARNLANSCFPERSTLQTIVIHNNDKYGGAGYYDSNMAVISTNRVGPKLAVHELGHSLFEFGDEYTYGSSDNTKVNCDVEGCPKWADLNDIAGENKLCHMSNCKGRKYYVGHKNSFMKNMFMPIGIVNLRFTCCTYLALTKDTPLYCDQFEFGNGLEHYCKNDYQGYGLNSYERRSRKLLGYEDHTKASWDQVTRHLTVSSPVVLDIGLESKEFEIRSSNSTSTMFRRHYVQGEFEDFQAAKSAGLDIAHSVQILFKSGETQRFVFGSKSPIMVPPADPFDETIEPKENEFNAHHTRKDVQIVVDRSRGPVAHVEIEDLLL